MRPVQAVREGSVPVTVFRDEFRVLQFVSRNFRGNFPEFSFAHRERCLHEIGDEPVALSRWNDRLEAGGNFLGKSD